MRSHALRPDAGQGDRLGTARARRPPAARRRLARARIHGVVTNRDLLVRVLRDRGFAAGELTPRSSTAPGSSTAQRAVPETAAPPSRPRRAGRAGGAARTVQRGMPVGWRNVARPAAAHRVRGRPSRVEWWRRPGRLRRRGLDRRSRRARRDVGHARGRRRAHDVDVAVRGDAGPTSTAPTGHARCRGCPGSPTRPTPSERLAARADARHGRPRRGRAGRRGRRPGSRCWCWRR